MITELKNLFAEYSTSRTWAQSFDWSSIPVKPLPIGKNSPVCALYSAIFDHIRIDQTENLDTVFALYCHELFHAYQRRTMGFIKYVLYKTVNRSSLEDAAAQVEQDAADWLGNYRCQQLKERFEANKRG